MRFDLPGDLLALGQHGLDRQPGRGAEFVERIEIERIARRDAQRAVLPLEREQRMPMDQLERESLAAAIRSILCCSRSTNGMPTSSPKRLERSFFAHQSEVDGRHVQPHRVRPVEPQLIELLGR